MGSSYGGVISLYAGLRHQNVFSKIGAMSTTFGVFLNKGGENANFFTETGKEENMKIYIDIGTEEWSTAVQELNTTYDRLRAAEFTENKLKMVVDEGAGHNEKAWAERFPEALLWLYEN